MLRKEKKCYYQNIMIICSLINILSLDEQSSAPTFFKVSIATPLSS